MKKSGILFLGVLIAPVLGFSEQKPNVNVKSQNATEVARKVEVKMPNTAPKIIVYSKSYCPFCTMAKEMLKRKGVAFETIDLEKNPDRMTEMLAKSNGSKTVPQIFVGDKHIGGYSDMADLDKKGELDTLLGK